MGARATGTTAEGTSRGTGDPDKEALGDATSEAQGGRINGFGAGRGGEGFPGFRVPGWHPPNTTQ